MRTYRTFLTVFFMIMAWHGLVISAQAQQKHALLIGINDYQNIPSLNKAVGDAQAMSETMAKLGFKVTLVLNPDRRALNKAITTFRAAIEPGDTAFVHYSGHGIEINGQNFLLPADIPKPNSGEQDLIESESLSLNTIINRIASSGAAVRIFVIDACRDNPFPQEGTRSIGTTRGLAEVKTTAGTFIFYSAGFGQTALDRLSNEDKVPTSVYTRVLIETIQQPYSHIGSIARKVRQKVETLAKSIGHTQFPAYYDELSGDYCLVCDSKKAQVADNSNHSNAGTGIPQSGITNTHIMPPNASSAQSKNTPTITDYPDLIIKSVNLSPTGQCKAGRPIMNSTIIVQNIGHGLAGSQDRPVMVNIRNTHAATKGWGNGSKLGVIRPGEESIANFPLFFLKDAPQLVNGLHEFKVTIDPKNLISESNKQNNIAYKEVSFSCPRPRPALTNQSADNSNAISVFPPRPSQISPARNLPKGGPKSFWNHSGSLMFLKADGNKRAFFYKNPRRILKAAGIHDGSLLFYGKVVGGNYIGQMRKFSHRCGTIEFPVHGLVKRDQDKIRVIFNTSVPVRNIRTCKKTGSKFQTLTFTFLYTAKNARIKPLDPRILPHSFKNNIKAFPKRPTFRERQRLQNRRFNRNNQNRLLNRQRPKKNKDRY